jgi:hypothetical protein
MLLRLARRAPDEVNVHDAHRVVELCGWLPLAIAITASQLRSHPGWPVRHLLDQLVHAHDRLDELEAGDRQWRQDDIRAPRSVFTKKTTTLSDL